MCAQLPDRDGGFSLPEVLVVVLITGIVAIILFTTMTSITGNSASVQAKSATLADARTALEVIARDLRAANPIDPITVSQYPTTVQFKVYCANVGVAGCAAGNLRQISYSVSTTDYKLRRTVAGLGTTVLLGPNGPGTISLDRQRGAIINDPTTQPVFAYYKSSGTQLTSSNSSENYRDCTKTVAIRLAVVSDPNKVNRKIDLSTTVNLRNFNEVTGCLP